MDLEINTYVGNYFLWEKDDFWWSQISFTIFGIFFHIIIVYQYIVHIVRIYLSKCHQ